MDPQTHLLNLLLAPVVLISACGLLCISATTRLGTILARIRTMHRERIDVHLVEHRDDARFQAIQGIRLDALQHQAKRMLTRATMIRNELFLLYVAILLLLTSSLLFGLSIWFDTSHLVAMAVFVVGIVSMIGAISLAVVEVARSLQAVRFEHERVQALDSRGEEGVGAPGARSP